MAGSLLFAANTDELLVGLGAANVTDAETFVVVINPDSGSANQIWLEDQTHDHIQYGIDTGNLMVTQNGSNESTTNVILPTASVWQTMAASRPAGGTTPQRFMRMNLDTRGVVYANGSTPSWGNVTAGTGWRIGRYWNAPALGGYNFLGKMACVAIWKRQLSDAETAILTMYSAFEALKPDALLRLDGSAPFNDQTPGGANQTALTGTAHSTSEPSGFWTSPVYSPHGMGIVLA
jgi:hypothetical protein